MKYFIKFWILILIILSSCSTFGNKNIDGQMNVSAQKLLEIERAIVPIEAAVFTATSIGEARRQQNEISSARQMITNMERESSADLNFSGQLFAWSGRLAILEGRFNEAVRLHRQSITASPANIPAIILGIRLEGDPLKRLDIIERELAITGRRAGVGELNIERGRTLTELAFFSESAGAFDIAFASGLNSIYRDSYTPAKDRAWELRNATGVVSGTLNLLNRETITWNDSITMARNETQLLRFITGGRNISDAELFSRLVERGFIPFTQDITINEWPRARPNADDTVTRAGAAWFIWHLYAEARAERVLLTRYSSRFATGANPRSPIADVPPLSPFFDSILGCIETEFLSLPDGNNFRPALPIRGAELLAILRRIDN